jgi:lipopolysaccharide/colanic/teichoic acid biosynthesis glycosyltransferase
MRRLAAVLLHAGVLAIVFGLSKVHAEYIGRYDFTESSRFGWAIGYCAWQSTVLYGVGLPDVPRRARGRLFAAFLASALGALGVSLVQLLVGDALLPRYVVFGTSLLIVPWSLLCARLSAIGRTQLEARDRVFVVACAPLGTVLQQELEENPERPATIVGVASPDELVGNGAAALAATVEGARASVVVLGPEALVDERIVDQAGQLHLRGVRVRTRSLFYEEWLGKIPVEDLARTSLFFDIGEVHRTVYVRFKRVTDVVTGLAGCAVLLLAVPLVAVGNIFGNRGPLLYRQERVGRGGRTFTILKFRTMRSDVSAPTDWTAEHDPRVTRFGGLLRRSHVDELPQMLNILRGDLSIVGPRPEQPRYVAELAQKLPFYDFRHSVRPGLTGWAQVKYGYAGDERDAREKLQYDFHYLRRQSLLFDLRIIGRTLRAVIGSDGR